MRHPAGRVKLQHGPALSILDRPKRRNIGLAWQVRRDSAAEYSSAEVASDAGVRLALGRWFRVMRSHDIAKR